MVETIAAASDADLIAQARDGDRIALDTLVDRYQPTVYRFGLRMCGGDADAAEDVLQDTLLSLARSVGRFRGEAALSTWLFTVARRACLRKRRRRKSEPAVQESIDALDASAVSALVAPGQDPEQTLARRELRAAVDAALAALKPAEREVLVLRDMQGLTAPEVAAIVGASVQAVKSRLHRARLALRERLEPVAALPQAADGQRCPDVLNLLSRHLEGDLSTATCAEMTAHVERCPRCGAACDSLKRALARCREAATPAPPPAIGTAVRDAIRIFLAAQPTSPSPAPRGSSSSPRGRSSERG